MATGFPKASFLRQNKAEAAVPSMTQPQKLYTITFTAFFSEKLVNIDHIQGEDKYQKINKKTKGKISKKIYGQLKKKLWLYFSNTAPINSRKN